MYQLIKTQNSELEVRTDGEEDAKAWQKAIKHPCTNRVGQSTPDHAGESSRACRRGRQLS